MNKIAAAYIRHYRDNGQTTAYIEWADGSRTEGRVCSRRGELGKQPAGTHMRALFARARKEGVKIEMQTW